MLVDSEQNDLNSFMNVGEKGSDCIVFQLGSHSVKFGLASQLAPFVIPNCIAHSKIKDEMEVDEEINKDERECTNINEINFNANKYELSDTFLSNLLNIEQETLKRQLKLEQKLKGKKIPVSNKTFSSKANENSESEIPERKNFEQAPLSTAVFKKAYAMSFDINEDISDNNYKWTSVQSEPTYLIGREALTIFEMSKYILRYPIKYGMFNTEYSYQAVLDDLNKIVEFCVVKVLQIPKKDFLNFSIVLILPDLFVKQQVKGLVNVFLRDLSFRSIFVHTESVMSSFGAALQSSCVVDIGSSKLNVCCIDEGMMIEETLIKKNFGGDDITKLLYMMLKRKSSSNVNQFDIDNPYHFRIIEKMKETECEFPSIQNPSSQFLPKSLKLWQHRKNKSTKIFNMTLTEPIYVPPLALMHPEIFESFRNVTIPYVDFYNDIYSEIYSDPEDVMADLIQSFLLADTKKEENLMGGLTSVKKSKVGDDEDSLSMSPSRSEENSSQIYAEKTSKKNTYESMFTLLALDDLICQSIMSVSSPELRKKLANAILLVGGGVKFKGLIDFLEDRLIDKLTMCDNEIDRVEIINFPTVDAKTLTWIGGTIIPKLESSKDMWISRERWTLDLEKTEEPKKEDLKDNLSNINDNESRKDTDTVVAAKEKQEKEKTKKKEKHLDGGVNLIREKCPFQW